MYLGTFFFLILLLVQLLIADRPAYSLLYEPVSMSLGDKLARNPWDTYTSGEQETKSKGNIHKALVVSSIC